MKLFRLFIFYAGYAILVLAITSCSVIGLNLKHATPKRAFKYPKFTEKDSLRGGLSHYRNCYDVYFYDLSVAFNLSGKSISGKVDFYVTATDTASSLQIDLYKNMILDSVVFSGSKLSYTRKFDAIFLKMNIQKNEKYIFTAYYHGKPLVAKRPPWEGGFVWKTDKNNKPWVGVACEEAGASLWWPVKDHLSDEPDSMKMHYTVPKDLKCVSNGVLIDSVVKDEKCTYSWEVTYPINTYNVTFYIGDFKHFKIPYKSQLTSFNMDFYVLPYHLDTAKGHFKQTKDILNFYERTYGAYPWKNDGFKLVEGPFEGMEHQTAIAYGNSFKNYYDFGFDYIILHESAHEWWGNSVTVPDYAEVWIHEGFATYSEALYVEHLKGYNSYLNYLSFYAMLISNKRPVVGPHDVNYWDYKDTDVYMKGALILHTLRNTLNNDSLFFAIVKEFYNRYKYKIVVSEDFIKIVNEKTGKDFSAFFKQYLYSRTCPELLWEFSYNQNSQKNEIYYKWSNAEEGFTIPIKVKTDSRVFIIRPTRKLQKSELPYDKTIVVNTEGSYIASKRTEKFK